MYADRKCSYHPLINMFIMQIRVIRRVKREKAPLSARQLMYIYTYIPYNCRITVLVFWYNFFNFFGTNNFTSKSFISLLLIILTKTYKIFCLFHVIFNFTEKKTSLSRVHYKLLYTAKCIEIILIFVHTYICMLK